MENPVPDSTQRTNVPELTVSELAFSLKRTLEETYGRVRVRGELSRVKIHTSGHMYSDLKDAEAVLNIVCWKRTLAKIALRPEEGLEVICTGRISSYPARSNYQMIVESMELAGAGALLRMLEERRRKLAAEGLFDAARKKKLPFLPNVIGVVTSPTGAVIRDIMHRLDDRFPRHVLLWPVLVQGPGAAEQIAAAIRGFDALPPLPPPLAGGMKGGRVPRPDVLIIARGGGSLEDLMAFNEESVVRAVAECSIPAISAVGHESDTTLIDHAADMRAPTPTAAAEMAVPVRLELLGWLSESAQRMATGVSRHLADLNNRLAAYAARLGDPQLLLEMRSQKLDHAAHKLDAAFARGLALKVARAEKLGAQLIHPQRLLEIAGQKLDHAAHRLDAAFERGLALKVARAEKLGALLRRPEDRIREKTQELAFPAQALRRAIDKILHDRERQCAQDAKLLESYSFKSVLARGFAVVRDESGRPLTTIAAAKPGQGVRLEFRDGRRKAVIDSD